ncbi:DgyrCDS5500 [Dimorphilus gyrociliatus]|uniref:DgyrCDS5500 n=1 Tax=Dimorphilus gyrociliatus TaxID=2664684 RepID=A0A7I8VK30_9ANNE|nr:DgyrCDS5500 [Dimorphilus gyrociliatus]
MLPVAVWVSSLILIQKVLNVPAVSLIRTINQVCGIGIHCDQRKNLGCVYENSDRGKCNCPENYKWNGEKCSHRNPKKFGENCKDSDARCIDYGNICKNGKCQCESGLKADGNICRHCM